MRAPKETARAWPAFPAKLVTFSWVLSWIMAFNLLSHSLIKETLLLGVLLNSAHNGMLSIKIADRSPKNEPLSSYSSLLPPRRRLFPKKSCEFSLLFRYRQSRSLADL